jgi:hypothetical protein
MRKIIFSFFAVIFLFQASLVQATTCDDFFRRTLCCTNISLDAKYAAFSPLDSRVRKIYGSALPMFTVEGNVRVCGCWEVWLDGSYVFGNGHSSACNKNKTHLSFVPISVGLKYLYPICYGTDLYIGAGPCYSFFNTKDHSEFVHENTSRNNWGAIVKSGFIYHYNECIFLEGFFNYMYQEFSFGKTSDDPFVYRQNANLSSLQLGIALGWNF